MRKFILLGISYSIGFVQGQGYTQRGFQRIADYGKLWNALNYFHPQMAYGNISADSLFTSNVNRLIQNPSAENFNDAVSKMLAMLRDPYTSIIQKTSNDSVQVEPHQLVTWLPDSIALVYFNYDYIYNAVYNYTIASIFNSLKNAHTVIIDLRTSKNTSDIEGFIASQFMQQFISFLSNNSIGYPAMRTRFHFGYEPEQPIEQLYYKGWQTQNGYVVRGNGRLLNCPVAVIINRFDAGMSGAVIALQNAKIAGVIADGNLDNFEPHTLYKMDLADGISVNIRQSEIIYPNGNTSFIPDTIIFANNNASSSYQKLIPAALQILKKNNQTTTSSSSASIQNYFTSAPPNTFSNITYPSIELRLYALTKYWGVINYFCPNKDLITKNWDSVLMEYIPKFLAAKDSAQYFSVVAALSKETNDGHGGVMSARQWYNMFAATPKIQVRFIQGKTIVYKVFNDSLKKIISPGDEITKLNDKPVTMVRDSLAKLITASNDPSLETGISFNMMYGQKNSNLKLTYLHNGTIRTTTVQRNFPLSQFYLMRDSVPVFKKISDKIGYADLSQLQTTQVDSMFDVFKNTNAIILDDRSYPQGTAWSIKDHLARTKVNVALVTVKIADNPSPSSFSENRHIEVLEIDTTKPLYKGKIIVLVNSFSVSQSEYSCLIFRAASENVTIIGSQTAGADGDISDIELPGGISTHFSGANIRYPDGRQTQGIGIVPDIKIEPTIAGIKAGKDEVLVRAIEFAKTGK